MKYARDRHQALVDLWRERPVKPQLRFASLSALVESGIVQEGKGHRPLDLESARTCQKNNGSMGVDALDRRAAMGGGIGQERQHRLLRFAAPHGGMRLWRTDLSVSIEPYYIL